MEGWSGPARAVVTDVQGRTIAQVTGTAREGFNRLLWNFQMNALAGAPEAGRGGRGGGRGAGGGPIAPSGEYLVTLEVGGEKVAKVARVRERIR